MTLSALQNVFALIPSNAEGLQPYSALLCELKETLCEQDVHVEARNLLSITLNGLTNFKCVDQYQPSASEPQPGSTEAPMQLEAWLTPRYGDLNAGVRPPQWYIPSQAEVSTAEVAGKFQKRQW